MYGRVREIAPCVSISLCWCGWLVLILSAAAGTNNTQGEMINTHLLYSISQHHFLSPDTRKHARRPRAHASTQKHRMRECETKVPSTNRCSRRGWLEQETWALGVICEQCINIYFVKNTSLCPGRELVVVWRVEGGVGGGRKDNQAVPPLKSATVITRGERESAH